MGGDEALEKKSAAGRKWLTKVEEEEEKEEEDWEE